MTAVKPILFSGPMVRAIIDGRKTQTRRVLHVRPTKKTPTLDDWQIDGVRIGPLPYAVGDLLWVRETIVQRHSLHEDQTGEYEGRWERPCEYVADGAEERVLAKCPLPPRMVKRPAIHMPRWASRLTLELTAVRVERLQEISRCDSIAEGILRNPHGNGEHWTDYPEGSSAAGWTDPRDSFRTLWNSLNARRGYGWDENPWVAAITFTVHRQNVDAILAARPAA